MGAAQSRRDRAEKSAPSRTGRPVVEPLPLPDAFLASLRSLFPGDASDQATSFASLFQLPGTPAYTLNATCWNFDAIGSPSAIFVPGNEELLGRFVKFWGDNTPPPPHSLSVAGGRHSHWGMCDHSVVIDMSSFDKKEFDEESRVGRYGAGLRLREFDAFNLSRGMATTAGTNPDTGIAGLTMGGGFGHLCRRHGLAADNLVGARVVLPATGEVVEARGDNEHADLLWALRGGGGNFGVVTEFHFQLHPRGDTLAGASVFLTRRFNDVASILLEWSQFGASAHRDLSLMAVLPSSGPALILPSAYLGDDLAPGGQGEALLTPLSKIGKPAINTCKRMPYCEANKWPGNDLQSSGLKSQLEGNWYESGVLLRELSPGAIEVLIRFTSDPAHVANKSSHVVLMYLGGAVRDVPTMDSAVGFRRAEIFAMILGSWPNQSNNDAYRKERSKVAAWAKQLLIALAPYSVSSYNTLGDVALDGVKSDMAAAGRKAEADGDKGSNGAAAAASAPSAAAPSVPVVDAQGMGAWTDEQYAKLQAVKARYDPHNVLRNNNNIKPKQ